MESKYLLSGFLVCWACGGRMMITKRTSKRGRPVSYYVCSTHRSRAGACTVKGSFRAVEAHDRVINLFLTRVLTPEALKQAIDSLVRKGSEVEVLAAQKAPHVAELSRLDRELANLTAAIASGQRPEIVMAAIKDREAAKKKTLAEMTRLDKLERAAREYDAGAAEQKLRAELKTWTDVLTSRPDEGRAVLRQILHGPIQAQWVAKSDTRNLYGIATFGGIVHRIFGVQMTDADRDEYNAYSDYLNTELAAGRDPFAESGPAPISGSSDATTTSADQRPMCPRGDSNTRHAV